MVIRTNSYEFAASHEFVWFLKNLTYFYEVVNSLAPSHKLRSNWSWDSIVKVKLSLTKEPLAYLTDQCILKLSIIVHFVNHEVLVNLYCWSTPNLFCSHPNLMIWNAYFPVFITEMDVECIILMTEETISDVPLLAETSFSALQQRVWPWKAHLKCISKPDYICMWFRIAGFQHTNRCGFELFIKMFKWSAAGLLYHMTPSAWNGGPLQLNLKP